MGESRKIKSVVSAGALVVNNQGKILTFFRGEPFNDVSFPKGKKKASETIEQAAIRECQEETGLEITIISKLGIDHYDYFWEPTNEITRKTVHYFLAKTIGGKLVVYKNGKDNIEKVEWLPVDELKKIVSYPSQRRILMRAEELSNSKP